MTDSQLTRQLYDETMAASREVQKLDGFVICRADITRVVNHLMKAHAAASALEGRMSGVKPPMEGD